MNYDHIVVDAVSTGHFLSLIKTPQGLAASVSSGPMHEQALQIQRVLADPQQTKTFVVTNLERYSLTETKELYDEFCEALGSEVAFVANKVFQVPTDLEPIEQSMPQGLQSFLQAQQERRSYQEQAVDQLKKMSSHLFVVPFYYNPISEVLGKDDEIRKLFTTT
jgi:anion-transporting  ArsA/GET3 family ATPase